MMQGGAGVGGGAVSDRGGRRVLFDINCNYGERAFRCWYLNESAEALEAGQSPLSVIE